jgi:hypothetical protein
MKQHAVFYHMLESVQYGFFYMVFAFIGGAGLDFLFPPFSESIEESRLVLEVTGQCMCLVLLTYFIRQLVTSVPFLFPIPRGIGFKPYLSDEFSGEMMMGLVFLGSQLHLIQKIDLLSTRLHHRFFEDEKYINGNTKKK